MSKKKTVAKVSAQASVAKKTKAVKKSAEAKEDSTLAAEILLQETIDPNKVMALKALLAQVAQLVDDLKNPKGYLMETIEQKINEPSPEAPKTEAKPKEDRGYGVRALDDDELACGPDLIKKAAKALAKAPKSFKAWAVIIEGEKFPPKDIYRKAFELDGFEMNWDFDTHKALTWLAHHGFQVERIG
jgi:hypothetical protein